MAGIHAGMPELDAALLWEQDCTRCSTHTHTETSSGFVVKAQRCARRAEKFGFTGTARSTVFRCTRNSASDSLSCTVDMSVPAGTNGAHHAQSAGLQSASSGSGAGAAAAASGPRGASASGSDGTCTVAAHAELHQQNEQ